MTDQLELSGLNLPPLPFSGERLTRLRKAAKLTIEALAAELRMKPGTVGNWESGVKRPRPSSLVKLCRFFGVLPEYFVPTGGGGISKVPFFRVLTAKASDMETADIYADQSAHLVSLLAKTRPFPPLDLPSFPVDLSEQAMTPEEAAQLTRDYFGLPSGPIPHLVSFLENKGVNIVFRRARDENDVMAFCKISDGWAIVVLDTTLADYYRQRFDLAHELAHLVMHGDTRVRGRAVEAQADRFAAELLMPAKEIGRHLPSVTTKGGWIVLATLKERWGVSLQSLLYRARRLGVMTDVTYRNALLRMTRDNWRKHEPGEAIDVERTTLIPERVAALGAAASALRVRLGMTEEAFRILTSDGPEVRRGHSGLLDH